MNADIENEIQNLKGCSLQSLARIIRADWRDVNYAAKPYLRAMAELDSIDQAYGGDTAESVVIYFLGNAKSWRGDVARAVKAELKGRLK